MMILQHCSAVYLFLFTLLWSATASEDVEKVDPQSPFLKEILMGRCYERPPTGNSKDTALCDSLVGAVVGVLQGKLDNSIQADDFDRYFETADFTSTTEGAIFWPPSSSFKATKGLVLPKEWTTVESTPGGSLMKDLVFCGIDLQQNCPIESQASLALWTRAYATFASKAKGRMRIVVDKGTGLDALLQGGIPSLILGDVTDVDIYTTSDISCSSEKVESIKDALHGAGFTHDQISCSEDVMEMLVCHDIDSPLCLCLHERQKAIGEGEDRHKQNVTTDGDHMSQSESRGIGKTKVRPNVLRFLFRTLLALIAISGLVILQFWMKNRGNRTTASYEKLPETVTLQ